MIEPFLKGELPPSERDQFIAHVRGCKDCHDELSVYNVIYTVLDQMDNNTEDENIDYASKLEEKLTKGEGDMRMRQFALEIVGVALAICIVVLLLILFM